LLNASPTIERGKLSPIPGSVPQLTALPPGCAFEPRCSLRRDECAVAVPDLRAATRTNFPAGSGRGSASRGRSSFGQSLWSPTNPFRRWMFP